MGEVGGETYPWLRDVREEAEENKRPEGVGGWLVRKESKRALLPSTDSDPPKIWAGKLPSTYCVPALCRELSRAPSHSIFSTAWKSVHFLFYFTGEITEAQRGSVASPKVPRSPAF